MHKSYIRHEIGSEFWDIPLMDEPNQIVPPETKWFISGTSALEWIVRDLNCEKHITTVSLPSWCCSCMIDPFLRNNIIIQFYPVYLDHDHRLICDFSNMAPSDATLLISYFGYTQQLSIGNPTGIIIRDTTHSIFTGIQSDADYYFGSLRKWAGFWTGGYAWKSAPWSVKEIIPEINLEYVRLRETAMTEKKQYLQGQRQEKSYLSLYQEAEDYLDQCMLMGGVQRDIDAACHFDTKTMKEQRRKNAEILLEELKQYAIFRELSNADCPLFVPIILEKRERDELRKHLIKQDIYCPIHWSITNLHTLTPVEEQLYNNELSIVCDQRYDTEDMGRIIRAIKGFLS